MSPSPRPESGAMPITDDVTQGHLIALGTLQTAILVRASDGPRLPTLENLGPFATVYCDDRGWTDDGPARARTLLAATLDRYVETDPKKGLVTAVGYDRTIRAAALRATWGVDRHPLSAADVVLMLAREYAVDPDLSIGSIANWAKDFALDREVQEAAWSLRPERPVPRALAVWPRPNWDGIQANWPPARNWPPGAGAPRNERAALLERARHHLRGVERARIAERNAGSTGSQVPPTQPLDEISDDDLLTLIRELAGRDLIERHFADETNSRLRRHAVVRIIGPWSDLEAVGLQGRHPGKISEIVAVATQMHIHTVVADRSTKRLIAAVDRLAERRSLPGITSTAFSTKLDSLTRERGSGPDAGVSRAVEDVYFQASVLRRSPELADSQIPAYLQLRGHIDVELLTTTDVIRLRLADQSASLDIARSGSEDDIKRLSSLMKKLPDGPQGRAYAALLHRDRAITWLQRNREDHALALVGQAFRLLNYLVADHLVDKRSAMEVRHQLCLAAAGDYIRLVERDMVNAPAQRHGERHTVNQRMSTWVRSMLHYSRLTRILLTDLEHEFDLPAERHSEGQISAIAWRIRTSIIELRAELVALTALGSGLASLEEGRGVDEAPESEPDRAVAAERYRDLVGNHEIAVADAAEAITLGMWVALLHGGELPVPYDLAPALRRLNLAIVLDGDTDGMSDVAPEYRTVDLRAASTELAGCRMGIIAEVEVDGPVGRFLTECSPGLFVDWRAWLPKRPDPERGETTLMVFFDRPPWKDRTTE